MTAAVRDDSGTPGTLSARRSCWRASRGETFPRTDDTSENLLCALPFKASFNHDKPPGLKGSAGINGNCGSKKSMATWMRTRR